MKKIDYSNFQNDFELNVPKTVLFNDNTAMNGTLSSENLEEGTINASWAEVNLNTPTEIITKMQASLFGNNTYSVVDKSFYINISQMYRNKYNIEISNKEVEPSPGIITGISFLIKEYSKEGDNIAVLSCEYVNLHNVVKNSNRICKTVSIEKNSQGVWEIDFKKLKRTFEICKMMIFSNPHNPTGTVFDRKVLERIDNLAKKYGVFVICDECHEEFVWNGEHTPYWGVSDNSKINSATFISPGKAYSLSDLKVGAVISGAKAIVSFKKQMAKLHLMHSKISVIATATPYSDTKCIEYIELVKKDISSHIDFTIEFFNKHMPELKVQRQDSLFTLWWDISVWNVTANEVLEMCAINKLQITSGKNFGKENFVRMNLAISTENLVNALKILLKVRNIILER